MRANEFVTEDSRVASSKPEIVSVQDDGKTITIKVRGNDGTVRAIANSNPAVLQQQLNLKYGLRLPHSIARKFVGMPAAMAEDQPDNPDSWESQAADAERDAETVRMADQDAKAGGLAEEAVDEDISRRGFLKGAGAAAVAGAGLATTSNAKADEQEINKWVKYATDLAIASMGWMARDTKYELREWLVDNVSKWVSDYCTKTNSYNAKEVVDYCNQKGAEASGMDKLNVVGKIFSNNMKDRYQDFLYAYRDGIKESYLKFNKARQVAQSDLEQKRRENMARMASANQGTTYAQKIIRRIKPNITFMDVDKMEGNPEAIVEIRCAPDGTILSRKLTKSSGNTEWDQAVIRAIDKSEQIPQDVDGKVPSPIIISFKPLDESVNQGVTKSDLNEKSTSQAQFRTMAAAAHNPEFAKKVGIDQSVAKEFHSADKSSSYKKLPKKATEDASWGMAPEGIRFKK
jgi:TonB family protein